MPWKIYKFFAYLLIASFFPLRLLTKLFVSNNVLATASVGGHLADLSHSLSSELKANTIFILPKSPHLAPTKLGKACFPIINPGRNPFLLMINTFQSLTYLVLFRPKAVISSGASLTFPLLFFARLLGSKTIFVETMAQIKHPSNTGRLSYPLSNLFIIQSEHLFSFFPKAKLGQTL